LKTSTTCTTLREKSWTRGATPQDSRETPIIAGGALGLVCCLRSAGTDRNAYRSESTAGGERGPLRPERKRKVSKAHSRWQNKGRRKGKQEGGQRNLSTADSPQFKPPEGKEEFKMPGIVVEKMRFCTKG